MWLVTSPSNKLRSSSHYIPTSQSDQRNVCGSYSHNMGIILHIKLLARNFLTDSWISVWDVNRRELWQLRCPDPPGLLHREHHHRAVRPSPAGGLGPGQEDQMYLVSVRLEVLLSFASQINCWCFAGSIRVKGGERASCFIYVDVPSDLGWVAHIQPADQRLTLWSPYSPYSPSLRINLYTSRDLQRRAHW